MKQNVNPAAPAILNTVQVDLPTLSGRKWSVHFDEPELSSDAGLTAIAASGIGDKLLADIATAIDDPRRSPDHDNAELIKQRVFQILGGLLRCERLRSSARRYRASQCCGP